MKSLKFKTYVDKASDIKRQWYIIDAQQVILGRLATEASKLLVAKHKPTYTPHIDNGDYVVVINTDKIAVSGDKEEQKIYYHYSGYRSGIKQRTVAEQRQLDSTKLIYMAIKGMLPKNKLQSPRLNRLKIYADSNHPHAAQKPIELKLKQIKKG